MRFSSNNRDRSTYADAAWSKRDIPFWMPERLANIILERLDWPMWVVYGALIGALTTALILAGACVREIRDSIRVWKSTRATREIVRLEEEEKARRRKTAEASAAAARTAPVPSLSGPLVRVCRYCDVPIADDFVEAHQAGKKHRRLASLTAGGVGADCWVWRRADTLPQRPTDDAAVDEAMPAPPPARIGGGDGGKGSWSVAKPRKKNKA